MTFSPASLSDRHGRRWYLHRRRLDLREVGRMLRRSDVPVVLAAAGLTQSVAPDERDALWQRVKTAYGRARHLDYLGREYLGTDGTPLLVIEQRA